MLTVRQCKVIKKCFSAFLGCFTCCTLTCHSMLLYLLGRALGRILYSLVNYFGLLWPPHLSQVNDGVRGCSLTVCRLGRFYLTANAIDV